MPDLVVLTLVTALGAGLVAGRVPAAEGIRNMQEINVPSLAAMAALIGAIAAA